jgi:tetratricopeptide (TPR) repeat protein
MFVRVTDRGHHMKTGLVALLLIVGSSLAHAGEPESALIAKAQAALQAHDGATAEGLFRQLTGMATANWTYLQGLADAQSLQGKYADAVTTYDKAIAPAIAAGDATSRAAAGVMLTLQGTDYLRLKKYPQAVATFRKATNYVPNQGVAWFNLCAAAYNVGDVTTAAAACDRAIAADPNKADAYFIKGSLMVGDSKTGPNGKIVPPKGTIETLQKYLALAPNGAHAKDVKDMLEALR